MTTTKIKFMERVDEARAEEIHELEEILGYDFKNKDLLNRALSHKSYTNELELDHNEQQEKLEFLGDGVLSLLLNEYLFAEFTDREEGYLAKIKSAVGSEPALAEIAVEIDLGRFCLLGRGEERVGGRDRPGFLADTLEAVLGAMFLDGGLDPARKFAMEYLETKIHEVATGKAHVDNKSMFQEWVQKHRRSRPSYRVQRARGPEHSKEFSVSVLVNGKLVATGRGKSKKEAEQEAARLAYEKLAGDKSKPRSRRGEAEVEAPREAAAEPSERERERGGERSRGRSRGGRGRDSRAPRRGRPERVGRREAPSRPPRRAKTVEALLPPKGTEDVLAWATGESFPRKRDRHAV